MHTKDDGKYYVPSLHIDGKVTWVVRNTMMKSKDYL